jgi:hypothetical protein
LGQKFFLEKANSSQGEDAKLKAGEKVNSIFNTAAGLPKGIGTKFNDSSTFKNRQD